MENIRQLLEAREEQLMKIKKEKETNYYEKLYGKEKRRKQGLGT